MYVFNNLLTELLINNIEVFASYINISSDINIDTFEQYKANFENKVFTSVKKLIKRRNKIVNIKRFARTIPVKL